MGSVSPADKAATFVSLHQNPGVFPIPNPWDIGSARLLEALGFAALATTSSGFAQTLGRADGAVTLDEKLQHCRALTEATTVPITADLENGFADDPESVADCIRQVIETGVVGGSIEDFTGDRFNPIYDFNLAVERVAAAVEAARACPFKFMLTARAEQQLRADDDIEETIKRLQAYEAAGADVLYAPGLKTLDEVHQVADSVNKPLNVLGAAFAHHTVAELGDAGAKRVSVGGGLSRLMATAVIKAATGLHERGDLSWMEGLVPNSEMKRLFARWDKPDE